MLQLKRYQTDLIKALKSNLPGFEAHLKLAPIERIDGLKLRERADDAKLSAVLIILFPENNKLKILFILRSIYDGVHSGQISFPGGQMDKIDIDLINTALRETKEEIGITLKPENIVGRLSEIYIHPSNFVVQPYVAFAEQLGELSLDPTEVQDVYKIALDDLLKEDAIQNRNVLFVNKLPISAPCFFVDNLNIWGATAMILNELLQIITSNNLAYYNKKNAHQ